MPISTVAVFQDMDGNELAFISQKLLAWGPTYHGYIRGQHYATVKKKLFTFLRCKFEVDIPGPDDLLTAVTSHLALSPLLPSRRHRVLPRLVALELLFKGSYEFDALHRFSAQILYNSRVRVDLRRVDPAR